VEYGCRVADYALAPRDITTALEQHVPLYRRSNAVAENKVAPMYQKKQATAQQAEAVVDALMKGVRLTPLLPWEFSGGDEDRFSRYRIPKDA
jgi:ABC-type transporter Mla maintaining outer membrane lipid asymmetry ATPase subunit MlaF